MCKNLYIVVDSINTIVDLSKVSAGPSSLNWHLAVSAHKIARPTSMFDYDQGRLEWA